MKQPTVFLSLILFPFFISPAFSAEKKPLSPRPEVEFRSKAVPIYRCGETFECTIRLPEMDGIDETFSVSLEDDSKKMLFSKEYQYPHTRTVTLKGTLSEPGFLHCNLKVTRKGKPMFRQRIAAVAFEPEKIRPGAQCPADFMDFWKAARKKLNETIPPDFQCTLLRTTGEKRFYEVTCANFGNTRTYAYLTLPVKKGKYPAIVRVPPAGPGIWRSGGGRDEINMTVNVFDRKFKDRKEYNEFNRPVSYRHMGVESRERYYYYKSILGVWRMLDYLCSLPEWNGKVLIMNGRSQGGAFALILAALDERVSAVSADVPAFGDQYGAAPANPKLLKQTKGAEKTAAYYDIANFCRFIRCPVLVSAGFIDTMCTPRSIYASFNRIPSEEKRIIPGPFTGHGWGERNTDFIKARNDFLTIRKKQEKEKK